MSLQIIKGLSNVYNGLSEVVEGVNPLVTVIEDGKNKDIAIALLNAGYTVEDIQSFVDVSRVQLDEFLAFEVEVQARLAAHKASTKAPRKAPVKKVA